MNVQENSIPMEVQLHIVLNLQILEDLEGFISRGPYSGILGFLSGNGDCDLML